MMRGRSIGLSGATILLTVMALVPPAGAQTYGEIIGDLKCSGSGPITVSGEGFASLATVAIEWDSPLEVLATTIADPEGGISELVSIPALAVGGDHEIKAKGRGRGGGTLVLKCKIKISVTVINGQTLISATPSPASSGRDPFLLGGIGAGVFVGAGILLRRRHRGRPAASDI